jgi:hypothetical protein
MRTEEDAWNIVSPYDMWVLDKLILSKMRGYVCGPVGMDVPKPGWYIVRPCVNMKGLGLGAEKKWLDGNTDHLPHGYFWCEFFEGRHLSVDYYCGSQVLAVEGFKSNDTFTRWDKWVKVDDKIPLPYRLSGIAVNYKEINCEYIGDKLIEVHLRWNPDFQSDIKEYIPVFSLNSPDLSKDGYRYIHDPEIHGRIGAWVK